MKKVQLIYEGYRAELYRYAKDWVVDFIDLPGCIGAGETVFEAFEEASINRKLWIEVADKIGKIYK